MTSVQQNNDGGNVVDLTPEVRVVPVNYSAVVTLPDGRQVSATTSYHPTPGSSPNRLLDAMMDSLERQRARAEIVEFDKDIEKHEEAISKAEGELARLDSETDKRIEELQGKHLDAGKSIEATLAKRQREAEELGREFDPEKPGVKSATQPQRMLQNELKAEVDKLQVERTTGKKNFAASMAMFRDAIEKAKVQRDKRVKIVG